MPAAPDNRKTNAAYDAIRRVFLATGQLKFRCKYADEKFEKVSAWSVGQHIEHVLAVNAKTLLLLANDGKYTSPANVVPAKSEALTVLECGVIPRGAGKAPESVLPRMTNYVDLTDDVERGTRIIDDLTVVAQQIAADDALYPHPTLGGITKLQWLRFLEIHVDHHLKIIADIVGRNAPTARKRLSGKLKK